MPIMGGITYRTKQGDMWDYIAWCVYGDESYVSLLYKSNPQYMSIFIFPDGCEIICPEVSEEELEDLPEWRDEEDLEAEDALDGISDEGEEDDEDE